MIATTTMTSTWEGIVIEKTSRALNIVAMVGIVVILGSISFDVFARYVLTRPTTWSNQVSIYSLVAVAFLGAASTQLAGRNVRVDLLIGRLAPHQKRVLLLIAAWIGILFTAITAWQAWLVVYSDYHNGSYLLGLMQTPSWLPKMPIALGMTILTASLLVEVEQIAQIPSRLRKSLPYLLMLLSAIILVVFGANPPALPGTEFGIGGVLMLCATLLGAASCGISVFIGLFVLVIGGAVSLHMSSALGLGVVTLVIGVLLAVLLAAGVRIAFVLGFVGALGIYFLTSTPFPVYLPRRIWDITNSFALIAVPMFVLMGALVIRCGMNRELFNVLGRALFRLPGGLAQASTVGCGIFAAVSGSSVATAATMGSVACPEMTSRGYAGGLAYGSVAAGGTLGILIPPSIPMIIYGTTVGLPVTTMFIAGLLPGLLMMLSFMLVIFGWAVLDPSAAGNSIEDAVNESSGKICFASYVDTALLVALILMVLGVLYGGVATASETGAIGALLAFLICLARGRITFSVICESLLETVQVTSFIFLIVAGASILTFSFDYLNIAQSLVSMAGTSLIDPWGVLLIVLLVYLFLGMFLDTISMLVLTLPIVFPLIKSLGFDPVWFGILVVIVAEAGLVTPPVGLNLFILQGISPDTSIRTIALGTIPFIAAMILVVVLLCVFPSLTLWLT